MGEQHMPFGKRFNPNRLMALQSVRRDAVGSSEKAPRLRSSSEDRREIFVSSGSPPAIASLENRPERRKGISAARRKTAEHWA